MEKKLIFILIICVVVFATAAEHIHSQQQSHLSQGELKPKQELQSSQSKSHRIDSVLAKTGHRNTKTQQNAKMNHNAKMDHNAKINHDKLHQIPLQNDAQDPAVMSPVLDIQIKQTAPLASGNYTVVSVASGLCLDVVGGETSDGTNVDVETCTNTSNQAWFLNLIAGNTYYLNPQTTSNVCLDVSGVSTSPGANVWEWSCWNGPNQQWEIEPIGENSYQLISVNSGLCLDVAGGATASGTNVDQSNCTGQTNQEWIITPWVQPPPPLTNGNYTVVSVASGLCLDVVQAGTSDGTNVDVETCTDTPNQAWLFTLVSENIYTLSPQTTSNMCLDVSGISTTPGANVQEWGCWGGPNQQWQVIPAGNNSYTLISVNSDLCLDVAGGATNSGTNVDQSNCNGQTNQEWIITLWVQPPPLLADGNYTVVSVASGLCLDVAGGGTNSGTNVDIETCTDTPNQGWLFTLVSGNIYTVGPQTTSNMCLDVSGISTTPGANVQEWSCWGGPNQQWQVIPAGNNSYTLISVNSDLCLDVAGGATNSGTNVDQSNCNGQTNQEWIITPWIQPAINAPLGNGNYTVVSLASGLCLDVVGGGTSDGTNVDIETCTDTPNQVWFFTQISGNTYYLNPQTTSNVCLDVSGISTSPGANVWEWSCWNGPNQQWQVVAAGEGSYTLISVNSGLCLDVAGGATNSGTNVDQSNCNGQTNQEWIITPWIQAPPPLENGNYTVVSVASGLCLDVVGGGTSDGTNVDVETCTDTPNQVWFFTQISGNTYYLNPQTTSNVCLDVSGISTSPGANVWEWSCWNGPNQQWQVVSAGNNSYMLISVNSGICLDVAGGATDSGTNVDQYTCTGETNQQWIITPWIQAPPPLENGNYTVVSVASGLCLDVVGGGTSDGTNVDVETCTDTSNQAWLFTLVSGNVYTLSPQTTSNMCLDVSGISTTPGANVQEWGCWGGPNQQWQIASASNNSYMLISVNSGICLDVAGGATDSGTNVDQYTCTGETNQAWIITPWIQPAPPLANGNYTVINVNSDLCLDVTQGGTTSGTNVDQATCTGASNQIWLFTQISDNTYSVQPQTTANMCLDVSGISTSPGANVYEWSCWNGPNQQWEVVSAGDGVYMLISVNSGLCLDVAGSSTSSGANVDQYNCTGQSNQQWTILPVASHCFSCPAGQFWSPDLSSCQDCNLNGCDTCLPTIEGAAWCTQCQPGYKLTKKTGTCKQITTGN